MRRVLPETSIGVLKTPLGWCALAWKGKRLRAFVLPKANPSAALKALKRIVPDLPEPVPIPQVLTHTILDALAGRPVRRPLMDLMGLTDFQRRVLKATATIPRGQRRSYAWVARECGHPKAVRAVGGALNANPLPLFIPCHRVVTYQGGLGGFNAGLKMKRLLLGLEDKP